MAAQVKMNTTDVKNEPYFHEEIVMLCNEADMIATQPESSTGSSLGLGLFHPVIRQTTISTESKPRIR